MVVVALSVVEMGGRGVNSAIIFGITQNTGVKYAQSFGGFGSFGSFSRVRAILLSTER